MNVHIKVNENPGEKLQSLSKKGGFICLGFLWTATIDQDVTHRLGRRRKTMRAISERRIFVVNQPQPGLMDQGCRLKRLAGRLLTSSAAVIVVQRVEGRTGS